MPDDAFRLVNATPSSTPRAKTEIHIFTVSGRKEPVKTSQVDELLPINSHKPAGRKQGMTSLLMLRVEVPTVKAVFKTQASRATGNFASIPIIAPRRNGKNIRRFEVLYQRSQEIAIYFQIVVEKHEDVFSPFLCQPVIGKKKIVFRRYDCLDRRKFAFNPGHIVVSALVVEDYNRTGAGKILRGRASGRQQMLQMFFAVVIQNRQTNGFHGKKAPLLDISQMALDESINIPVKPFQVGFDFLYRPVPPPNFL
jgi:hypothetical protein